MSADRSESRVSRSSPGRKKPEKPPFKLRFSRDQQLGKSDLCLSRNDGNLVPASKFYSKECEETRGVDAYEALETMAQVERKTGPDASCRWPPLTSRSYGWWHERGIRPKESGIDFRKKTSDLVDFQTRIYAEDRKLFKFKHRCA